MGHLQRSVIRSNCFFLVVLGRRTIMKQDNAFTLVLYLGYISIRCKLGGHTVQPKLPIRALYIPADWPDVMLQFSIFLKLFNNVRCFGPATTTWCSKEKMLHSIFYQVVCAFNLSNIVDLA